MRASASHRALVLVVFALGAAAACSSPPPTDAALPPEPPSAGDPPASPPDATAPSPPPEETVATSCVSSGTGPTARDVDVVVRTQRGPKGAEKPVSIDRRVFGMSIADWRPEDYTPAPSRTFLSLLAALEPGVLRWPAGHRSQEYVWERGGAGQGGAFTLTRADFDAFVSLAKSVGAEPLVAVNVKTGTTAAATDLLRYLNVERGYGVRWFQIGNEPDLVDGITPSPEAYADALVRFTDALRAVDPSVRIVAPELLTGAHVGGFNGARDWLSPILARAGDKIDGLSWHYYPLDSGQKSPSSSATMSVDHLFQEGASDWRPAGLSFVDDVMPMLGGLRDVHAPRASIWITEFAEDPGPDAGMGLSDTLAAALWTGDALGRYAEYGPGAILRWLFKSDPLHAYALLDVNEHPRPTYGAYWLYARLFGDRLVDAQTSAIRDVGVHAALRGDGAVSVMLVNKTTSVRRVHVDLQDFCVDRTEAWTLEGDGLSSMAFRINGEPLTAENATSGVAPTETHGEAVFDVVLPPASMRAVVYRP